MEWSGLLFFKVEGSVKDLPNLKIIADSMFLKDIGDTVTTAYEFDIEDIQHMQANPHLQELTYGKIHSHHGMNVFHSKTDWDDLFNNSVTNNYYLSLIVNNAGDVEVKIAWAAKNKRTVKSVFQLRDENGNYEAKEVIEELEEDVLITANGDIYVEEESTDAETITRYKHIVEKVKAREAAAKLKTVKPAHNQIYASFPSKPVTPAPQKPLIATRNFLGSFISMGAITDLHAALKRVSSLNESDYKKWCSNIESTKLWDDKLQIFFGDINFRKEMEVIEDCKTILKPFEKQYPELCLPLLSVFDGMYGQEIDSYATDDLDGGLTWGEIQMLRKFSN